MPSSPEYHALCKRIAELRIHLLPAAFDPTGSYPPAELDKTRAFVALVHAEIEAFIEERCLFLARESVSYWLKNRSPNAVVFSLFAICYTGWIELDDKPDSLPPLSKEHDVEKRLVTALKQYEKVVGDNNGIKDQNLKRLLVPLSVRIKDELDEDWITSMSNFGGDRGKIVHMTWKANQPPDPKGIRETVGIHLLPGLKKIDQIIVIDDDERKPNF